MIIQFNGNNIVLSHDGEDDALSKAFVSRKKTGRWVIAISSSQRSEYGENPDKQDEFEYINPV